MLMHRSCLLATLLLLSSLAFGEKVAVCTENSKTLHQGISSASLIQTNSFTIEAWVKPTDHRDELPIVSQYYGSSKGIGRPRIIFGMRQDTTNNLHLGFFSGNYCDWVLASNTVPLNVWTHVAVTRTDHDLLLYMNGTNVLSYTQDKAMVAPPPVQLTVGGYRSSLERVINDTARRPTFPGKIADARVWNYVRTQEEIAADKGHRLTGGEKGLIAYWPLNEVSGNTTPEYVMGVRALVMDFWSIEDDDEFSLEPAGGIRTAAPAWPVLCGTSQVKRSLNSGFALGAESDFTFEAWVNPTNGCNNIKENRIASQYAINGEGRMIFELWYGKPALFQGADDLTRPMMDTVLPENTWTHVACVRKFADKTVLFYTNGVWASSTTVTSLSPLPANTNLFILGGVNNTDPNFLGCLRDFRVWETARTAEEIRANFQKCLTGRETGLRGYWPLEDGSLTFRELVSGERQSWTDLTGLTWLVANDPNSTAPYMASSDDDVYQTCFGGDMTTGGETGLKIPTNTTDFTVEAWVCPKGVRLWETDRNEHYILMQYIGDDAHRFGFGLKSNRLYLLQLPHHYVSDEHRISNGTWSHVAISRKDRVVSFYINGELVETVNWDRDSGFSDTELTFASRPGNFDTSGNFSGFNGGLREVRVWTVARTAEEIALCYDRKLSGREQGLFAYWPMNNTYSELTTLKNKKKGASTSLLRTLWQPLPSFPSLKDPAIGGIFVFW